jgi:hypothetical protein
MERIPRLTAALLLLAVPAAPALAEQIDSRDCKPEEVAVFETRVHVKCAPIAKKAETENIRYFAIATKDKAGVLPYVVEMLVAAKAANRELKIWYDRSDYKSVPGCSGSDCRRLTAVVMY